MKRTAVISEFPREEICNLSNIYIYPSGMEKNKSKSDFILFFYGKILFSTSGFHVRIYFDKFSAL